MNANRALWEKGDFTRIAESMRASGEEIVSRLAIRPGMDVLDLGCGDGTTAVPAAQQGACVTGVDIAASLVEAGTRRARGLELADLHFRQGDAGDLAELQDNSFDLTMSFFGAMFAPRPFDVAREMVRVTRPGGRIVMGNWIPQDATLVAQILRISAAYTPPPPDGFVSPMTWGSPETVVERFSAAGVPADAIALERDLWTFSTDDSPAALLNTFRTYYGPTMNAYEAAEKNGKLAELHQQLEQLFDDCNSSLHGGTTISARYLRVMVDV